jgi:hypothetical protein
MVGAPTGNRNAAKNNPFGSTVQVRVNQAQADWLASQPGDVSSVIRALIDRAM